MIKSLIQVHIFHTLSLQARTYHMPNSQATDDSAKERFWDRFIARARQTGAKENALPWLVHRAEAYLTAFTDKRLRHHALEDVTGDRLFD